MARLFGTPNVVGEPSDWFQYDEKGNVVSRDAYGQPTVDMDLWAKARSTANGAIQKAVVLDTGKIVGGCIGASDASVHSGIFPGHENGCRENTFNSKLALFHRIREDEKVVEENDDSKEKIFAIGHDYEDAAAIRCLRVINEKLKTKHLRGWLVNDERMYQCGAKDEFGELLYPHLIADVDRLIYVYPIDKIPELNGEWIAENPPEYVFGYELKTTRQLTAKWEVTDENPAGVPENYQVQVHQYMAILGLDGFYIGVIPYYMDADPVTRFIPQNEEIEKRILENGERFVENAILGKEPKPEEDDPEKRLKTVAEYEPDKSGKFDATALSPFIEKVKALQEEKKALDAKVRKESKAIDSEIAKVISENIVPAFQENDASIGIVNGEVSVSLLHKTGRSPKTNIDALKEKNPELAKAVLRETLLPMSKLKAAEREALKQFQTPDIKPELELKITNI